MTLGTSGATNSKHSTDSWEMNEQVQVCTLRLLFCVEGIGVELCNGQRRGWDGGDSRNESVEEGG